MEMNLITGFWVVSFLISLTPGADWAYIISAGIQGRRIHAAITGLISGHVLITLIVIAGMGIFLAHYPRALSLLTILGAVYLLWLGISLLRNPAAIHHSQQQNGSWRSWAFKGLCTSGLNPKVLLLFLALLPQFTDPQGQWPVALQMSLLGFLHLITCTLVYLLVGYGAKVLLTAHPKAASGLSLLSGIMIILISMLLFYEQFR